MTSRESPILTDFPARSPARQKSWELCWEFFFTLTYGEDPSVKRWENMNLKSCNPKSPAFPSFVPA